MAVKELRGDGIQTSILSQLYGLFPSVIIVVVVVVVVFVVVVVVVVTTAASVITN